MKTDVLNIKFKNMDLDLKVIYLNKFKVM